MIIASGAIKMTEDPASLLKGDEKPEQIIDVAISLERDSIVFYMYPCGFVKDVDRREEVGHVKQLEKIRERVAPK